MERGEIMDKKEVILAVLAAADGAIHTPVQVQKILFLIDKKISNLIGGPYFNFTPYAYGPFDVEIYHLLENLAQEENVEIISNPNLRWAKYRLTIKGQKKGEEILNAMEAKVADYIKKLSSFIRSLSFAELISVIYNEFPEMKVNSVFKS